MKYFAIVRETSSKVIGCKDGFQTALGDICSEEVKFIMNLRAYNPFTFSNCIKEIEFKNCAKANDVLNCGGLSAQGLLVSGEFRNILEDFSFANIQFVDVCFKNRPDIKGYCFLFFLDDLTTEIDYSKTDLKIKYKFPSKEKIENIDFNTIDRKNILKLFKERISLDSFRDIVPNNKYFFKEGFHLPDVFRIGHFDKRYYFSQNIVNVLNKYKLTGFYFVESTFFEH